MTTINATINGESAWGGAAKRLDIWHEGGGIGRFEMQFDNSSGGSQLLDCDQVAVLGINGTTLMNGYVDDILPNVKDVSAIFSKYGRVVGRNYGKDLAGLFITKNYRNTKLDDLVDDALSEAGSEITFSSPSEAPEVDAKFKDTFLQIGFVEAFQMTDYDFLVNNSKEFQMWALANAPSSGVLLKAVAGDPDNNILKIEVSKVGVDRRSYVKVNGGPLDDHYTEGNAEDWSVTGGSAAANDTDIQIIGGASIRVTSNDGEDTEVSLTFPRYNHDVLDFTLAGSEQCSIYVLHTSPASAKFYIVLEDDEGNIIRWLTEELTHTGLPPHKIDFLVGGDAPFGGFLGGWDEWYYESGSSFTWRVVRVAVRYVYGGSGETTFWLDGLRMPSIETFAIAEDEE
jgi:hypothetical protein